MRFSSVPTWRSFAAAAAAGAVTLAACGDGSTLPDGTLAPVRIGLIVSLQGNLAELGQAWKNAALLAEQEINAAGGPLPGRRAEMIIADDETNENLGGQIAQDLLGRGVVAIIGGGASSVSTKVAEQTYPAQVPQISCCSTSPALTTVQPARDRYFFRTVGSDLVQANVLANAALVDYSCQKLTIFVQNDTYGMPFGEAIEREFMSGGGMSVQRIPFTVERSSYATEVAAGIASMADCIAIVGFGQDAGTIRREWQLAGGPAAIFIGTDGVKDRTFIEAVGDPALADTFVGTAPFSGTRMGAGATQNFNIFYDHYRAVWSTEPVIFASSQYDAAALILLAIARAGTTNGPAIRDALYEVANLSGGEDIYIPGQLDQALMELRAGSDIDYDGASGPVNIDELGNVKSDYEIWRFSADANAFQTIKVIRAQEIDL